MVYALNFMIRTLISIWPMALREIRPRYEPVKVYEVPAAPFDGFVRLKITDQQESDYIGGGRTIKVLVPAEELAQDLAKDFRRFACGDSGAIGVWVADENEPTDEEILASPRYKAAREEQDKIFRNLIIEARILKADPKTERAISEKHYVAAAYLNIEGEDWQNSNMKRAARKECPFCQKYVSADAFVCSGCHEIIDAEGYAKQKTSIKSQIDALEQQATLPDNGGSALRPSVPPKPVARPKDLVGA